MSASNQRICRRLKDRVAIVTGATKGIGEAIAERLGREGAKVVISSRQQTNVDETITRLRSIGIDAEGIVCHVGKSDDCKRLVQFALEKYGRIDILVNNAGINPHVGDILEISEEKWDRLFDVNVKAGFMLSQLVVPHMEKVGGGSIVFNSSYSAYQLPPMISSYGVSKTTLLGLTKALANTLALKNIRVNCIAPGMIKTNFSRVLWDGEDKRSADKDYSARFLLNVIPMKRLGLPEECASTVAFLVSNDASYITGETVVISGGIKAPILT
jgi:dehydrogenase/reductase SDR family protein 4